ncbi:MAG: hypothetical protein PUE12_18235 [Oscillospiraceae bacterium]|nr:hypothetical protein [Oscillospiraceae bacterium]
METRYGYKYATIRENGLCTGKRDSTDYILDRLYVPISNYDLPYLMKYYYPIPETVNSFNDFQGKWYLDSGHQNEATELNG